MHNLLKMPYTVNNVVSRFDVKIVALDYYPPLVLAFNAERLYLNAQPMTSST